ncbi:M35 family metallo-endopeptidase [Rheinheimera tilapiae]|uniref:M35 family metallo-endopeptidase n=1 Tax=Rheinheimera tilapiae TaxID=875043 RepID=A0ABV6BJ74_9GAMM
MGATIWQLWSAAKSLALSNPTQAVKNADSHEYFAENTPAQN